ncbi:hypothetical protein Hypma_002749 [Hypsizygus marmoreus]|uniref:Uncharacterized protein n=1 Tax=Hypsizygus marmoreus TaxID=39966 RepID=A0A369JA17_HYPMA|nr:hypothetical protein Hypma_002749 [Hypsizygus marmoreus]
MTAFRRNSIKAAGRCAISPSPSSHLFLLIAFVLSPLLTGLPRSSPFSHSFSSPPSRRQASFPPCSGTAAQCVPRSLQRLYRRWKDFTPIDDGRRTPGRRYTFVDGTRNMVRRSFEIVGRRRRVGNVWCATG